LPILTTVEHPKDIGDKTTLAVVLALRSMGFVVSEPFGENARYDLVVDDGDKLARVQCKTGRLRLGAVRFATCSSHGHHRNPADCRRTYAGQIDLFAVYCPETSRVYLVPVDDVPNQSAAALRVDAPRNRQRKRIREASAYEVGTVAFAPIARLRATAGE
jgi:hypothetical protein